NSAARPDSATSGHRYVPLSLLAPRTGIDVSEVLNPLLIGDAARADVPSAAILPVRAHAGLFRDLHGSASHGSIGVGNTLGLHDSLVNRPLCQMNLDDYVTISAAAPSLLRLTFECPARLFGFLNAGA